MARLDTLPEPVFCRLVKYLDPVTMIRLAQVNWQLNTACSTSTRFMDFVKISPLDYVVACQSGCLHPLSEYIELVYHQHLRRRTPMSASLDWSEERDRVHLQSPEMKKQIAVAVHRTIEFWILSNFDEQDDTHLSEVVPKRSSSETLVSSANYLPLMIILGYPLVWSLRMDLFVWFRIQGPFPTDTSHAARLIFILNSLVLHNLALGANPVSSLFNIMFPEYPKRSYPESLPEYSYDLRQDLFHEMQRIIIMILDRMPGYKQERRCTDWFLEKSYPVIEANSLVLLLALVVAIQLESAQRRRLPRPSRMPFKDCFELQRVYNNPSFHEAHLRRMTSAELFSSRMESWTFLAGIPTRKRVADGWYASIGPLIEGIRLSSAMISEEDAQLLGSDWRDSIQVGTALNDDDLGFHCRGFVNPDGRVSMQLKHVTSSVSTWCAVGRMTPYSILGVYRRFNDPLPLLMPGDSPLEGHFWMYKRRWCHT